MKKIIITLLILLPSFSYASCKEIKHMQCWKKNELVFDKQICDYKAEAPYDHLLVWTNTTIEKVYMDYCVVDNDWNGSLN